MEGVWSDSKTFKLIELFKQYDCQYDLTVETITVTEQEKKAVIKEIAHVLDITGAYKFEC